MKKKISIVVPCYNEEESLPYFYDEIKKIENEFAKETLVKMLIDAGCVIAKMNGGADEV